jgi:hypothetical protein
VVDLPDADHCGRNEAIVIWGSVLIGSGQCLSNAKKMTDCSSP